MKLLILCKSQFGYHLDTWYYSKYLSKRNKLSYICFDYGKEKFSMPGVDAIYVCRKGNSIVRMIRYINFCSKAIVNSNPDVIFIKYFFLCSVLRVLFPRKKFVFDIRTGDVTSRPLKRFIKDFVMKLESYFYNNISIISESLRDKLSYSSKTYILPLGAEQRSFSRTRTNELSIIYIGTLSGRSLEKVLYGISEFVRKYSERNFKFTFIGDGWGNELQDLLQLSKSIGVDKYVEFTGFKQHSETDPYFERADVGLSFVPITSYFDNQPVTKTFEYLLAGLPVIATMTSENKKIINSTNGLLIEDTSEGVCNSIRWCFDNTKCGMPQVDSNAYKQFSWQTITSNFEVFLQTISNK